MSNLSHGNLNDERVLQHIGGEIGSVLQSSVDPDELFSALAESFLPEAVRPNWSEFAVSATGVKKNGDHWLVETSTSVSGFDSNGHPISVDAEVEYRVRFGDNSFPPVTWAVIK